MPLTTAQSFAWHLARTLMTVIVLVRTDQGYSAIPITEFDGDVDRIVREYDPWSN